MIKSVGWETRVENLVANTARLIVQDNPHRIMLSIVNLGSKDAFIAPGSTVAATGDARGAPLLANYGNAYIFKAVVGDDGTKRLYLGEVWAVATDATSISISEESEVD